MNNNTFKVFYTLFPPRSKVNGLSVAFERTGEGPALVLLHGFTHDSHVWRPQTENLSAQFTVIAWDAPGAGQEFYRRHSARVLSLVLADTYAGWKGSFPEPIPEERLAACLRDASLPPNEFVPKYLPGMFSESPTQEVREELASIMSDFHPVGFRLMATALAKADTRDLLPNIRVPTLLVWGEADKRSPISVAYQIRDAIPGARLAVISGAGHVSNLEEPVQFNTIVRDFCLPLSTR